VDSDDGKLFHALQVTDSGLQSFPGWLLSPDGFFPRKDDSRVTFPEKSFPGGHFPG